MPFSGKGAVINKAIVTVLTSAGLTEVEGSSDFIQRVHVRLTVDGRISDLLEAKYAGAIVEPISVRQQAKWFVCVTQASFDLVAGYLP